MQPSSQLPVTCVELAGNPVLHRTVRHIPCCLLFWVSESKQILYSYTANPSKTLCKIPDYVYRKCNTALIRGPAGAYVVNPGSVWNGPELLSSLKAAGIHEPEKDIKGVICTDGHAEHVGCMSTFGCADIMIVGYDIQMRGDKFLEHDFSCGITPYEFDENFCVIGTPGQRGPQVSLIVNGRLVELKTGECRESCRIAVTGNLFMDVQDASRVSFLDTLEGNYGESNCDKENLINGWRQSRMSILERADWVVPAYGPPFKVKPEYSSTPCVELA
ncbi:unnamed protein product [Schistosoma mattheei]|uniref:Metallo-beta-lactamase domain-containing protein 1 n=1 Tax=Schistosoma mattheei TaxID=31246 RepID=A0AA85C4D1_9TREM|nr:unnamed protein product [Schistosoma mattheei]